MLRASVDVLAPNISVASTSGRLLAPVPAQGWHSRRCSVSYAARSPAQPVPSARHLSTRLAATTPSAPQVGGVQPLIPVAIPQSQLEAVQAAVAALKLQVQGGTAAAGKLSSKKPGFGSSVDPTNRFAIEIPAADDSPAGTAELAASALVAMGAQQVAATAPLTVIFADDAAAQAATKRAAGGSGGWRVLGLQAACRQERLGGTLLLVAPKVSDVALVEQLLEDVWVGGPAAVVLNAQWASEAVPPAYRILTTSFAVLYSFLPISVKGVVGSKEGAVLRSVGAAGSVAVLSAPWRILYQTGGQFCQVGQTKARPRPEDLELAFYNASAATSPLTGVVKFFKAAADAVTGKRKS